MPQKLTKAVIHESAFVVLVAAALEVHDKETLGLLIGSQHKNKLLIKNALVYQKAKRTKWEVNLWEKFETKSRYTINELTGNKIIGDFHSHPDGPLALSKHDKIDMIEGGERIALLISVEEVEERIPWYFDKKDKALWGTIHDESLIGIKLYHRVPGSKVITKLKIECPYTKRLNKAQERY